jgi:hypothetical protein
MTQEECLTCNRLFQFHQDCVASIQKLKQLARAARAACDSFLLENLVETVKLMENESADLLRAMEEHRKSDHEADI